MNPSVEYFAAARACRITALYRQLARHLFLSYVSSPVCSKVD
jgi:hypothetical protein